MKGLLVLSMQALNLPFLIPILKNNNLMLHVKCVVHRYVYLCIDHIRVYCVYVICSSDSNLVDNLLVDMYALPSLCPEPDLDMVSAPLQMQPALELKLSTSATPDEPGFASPVTLTPGSRPVTTRPKTQRDKNMIRVKQLNSWIRMLLLMRLTSLLRLWLHN